MCISWIIKRLVVLLDCGEQAPKHVGDTRQMYVYFKSIVHLVSIKTFSVLIQNTRSIKL